MADAIDDGLIKALKQGRDALQRMMDAYLDFHDAHSLTQSVTGTAGNAFEDALSARDAIDEALSRHKAPLSVAGDDVERLIEARKVVAKEYRRLGLNPNPVLRGDFDAGVEVQAALRSQSNKVSKPL